MEGWSKRTKTGAGSIGEASEGACSSNQACMEEEMEECEAGNASREDLQAGSVGAALTSLERVTRLLCASARREAALVTKTRQHTNEDAGDSEGPSDIRGRKEKGIATHVAEHQSGSGRAEAHVGPKRGTAKPLRNGNGEGSEVGAQSTGAVAPATSLREDAHKMNTTITRLVARICTAIRDSLSKPRVHSTSTRTCTLSASGSSSQADAGGHVQQDIVEDGRAPARATACGSSSGRGSSMSMGDPCQSSGSATAAAPPGWSGAGGGLDSDEQRHEGEDRGDARDQTRAGQDAQDASELRVLVSEFSSCVLRLLRCLELCHSRAPTVGCENFLGEGALSIEKDATSFSQEKKGGGDLEGQGEEDFQTNLYRALRSCGAACKTEASHFVLAPDTAAAPTLAEWSLYDRGQTRAILELQQVLLNALEEVLAVGLSGPSSLPLLAHHIRLLPSAVPFGLHLSDRQNIGGEREGKRRRIKPTVVVATATGLDARSGQGEGSGEGCEQFSGVNNLLPASAVLEVKVDSGTGGRGTDTGPGWRDTPGEWHGSIIGRYLLQQLHAVAQVLRSSSGAGSSPGGEGIPLPLLEQYLQLLRALDAACTAELARESGRTAGVPETQQHEGAQETLAHTRMNDELSDGLLKVLAWLPKGAAAHARAVKQVSLPPTHPLFLPP